MLGGVEACYRDIGKRKWTLDWEERGRKYGLERRLNEAGRFIFCSVCDLGLKEFNIIVPEGKGLFGGGGGWYTLAEKLRGLGVEPNGDAKSSFILEAQPREKGVVSGSNDGVRRLLREKWVIPWRLLSLNL